MDSGNDEMGSSEPSTSKSIRTRKAKEKSKLPGNQINHQDWTEDEKMRLATALQKYGHLDVEKLHEEVKTKTPAQIKHFVYWAIKRSRIYFTNDDVPGRSATHTSYRIFSKSPIDQWLSAFEEGQVNSRDEFRDCLGKALMYISRFESHPDPTDCGGVDYAAMYEFLYQAVNGYPVKAVNPQTAAVLLEELDNLFKKMSGPGSEKEREHLSKVKRLVFVDNATKRHYGRKDKGSKSSRPIESLLDIKGFNPLSIPYDVLAQRPNSKP
ncbi:hypothetical protein J437_LFUL012358 [Ladona fulva]|uniref:SANT domain-containing protein n=1 Tax=Ladona fulva TaxID=123851 RepID=A0A8K0K553_LADFU|nr:hypothetical protein J437_LFUL012358 [Ladona fulva]